MTPKPVYELLFTILAVLAFSLLAACSLIIAEWSQPSTNTRYPSSVEGT